MSMIWQRYWYMVGSLVGGLGVGWVGAVVVALGAGEFEVDEFVAAAVSAFYEVVDGGVVGGYWCCGVVGLLLAGV